MFWKIFIKPPIQWQHFCVLHHWHPFCKCRVTLLTFDTQISSLWLFCAIFVYSHPKLPSSHEQEALGFVHSLWASSSRSDFRDVQSLISFLLAKIFQVILKGLRGKKGLSPWRNKNSAKPFCLVLIYQNFEPDAFWLDENWHKNDFPKYQTLFSQTRPLCSTTMYRSCQFWNETSNLCNEMWI